MKPYKNIHLMILLKKTNRVPFIITHNPALPNIHKILHRKQPILHSSERLSEIFKETPVVAYRRSPNLRDLLVRAKLKTQHDTKYNPWYISLRIQTWLSDLPTHRSWKNNIYID